MSQNCKSTFSAATIRDANNNTLYHSAPAQNYNDRRYSPPSITTNGNYQQVTAKVLIGSMSSISDLKNKEQTVVDKEGRRLH